MQASAGDRAAAASQTTPTDNPATPVSDPSDTIIVTFASGDPENPRNWSEWRKWTVLLPIILMDLAVSWGASGFSPAISAFTKTFNVSQEVGILGLSLFVLGLAFGPLVNAPLSEYYGRSPMYIGSWVPLLCFYLGCALVSDLGGFLTLRFLSGFFSAVTVANLGGTIADMWDSRRTGIPMSVFLWAATIGSPTGYTLMSFIVQYRPWRDVFWALLGISAGAWLIMLLCIKETRHPVLLRRRAAALRRRTGSAAIDVPESMRKGGLAHLFRVSLGRPWRFLFTEAIIVFGALYNGYLYGLSFLFNGAFALVFGPKGHGFGTLQTGLSFLGIAVGITLGALSNLYQERYFQRRLRRNGGVVVPETRIFMSQFAAVAFPASLFWFAWTSDAKVPWIVPILASGLWGWSFYTLILMTYMYTEDSYKEYSASALAGLGLIRNVAGAGFPLFGEHLYEREGYAWASSLLAFLALAMVPIPFVLRRYGRRLRLRSPWARGVGGDAGAEEGGGEDEAGGGGEVGRRGEKDPV